MHYLVKVEMEDSLVEEFKAIAGTAQEAVDKVRAKLEGKGILGDVTRVSKIEVEWH